MNDNAKLWVEALRSGQYKQCKGRLRKKAPDGDEFCCLGIACYLYQTVGPNGLDEQIAIQGDDHVYVQYGDALGSLPDVVMEWLGVGTALGNYELQGYSTALSSDNDYGKSFSEIAAIIEGERAGLFVDTP